MNYTLSVFGPESGVHDTYNDSELSHDLKISYENLLNIRENSFLHLLVKKYIQLINGRTSYTSTTGCQTESLLTSDFDEKMREIDKKFANKIDLEKLMPSKAFEEKMIKFQKECEIKFKSDLQSEVIFF
jgi:hypothetical protein